MCSLPKSPKGFESLFTMVVKKVLNCSATIDLSNVTTPSIFKPMLLDLVLVVLLEPNCLRVYAKVLWGCFYFSFSLFFK